MFVTRPDWLARSELDRIGGARISGIDVGSYTDSMNYRAALNQLDTERLSLRWLTEDDAPLMLTIWNDPAFIKHVGDRGIRTVEQAVEALRDGALAQYRDHGLGPYRLVLKGTGETVGICGLFQRDHLEHPDIGYSLLPGFRARGYALEAALAVQEHAREHMGLSCLTAIVTPVNERSVRLLEKLGMQPGKRFCMPGEGEEVVLYQIKLGRSRQ